MTSITQDSTPVDLMNAFAMQGRQVLLGALITGMTLFTLVVRAAESTNHIRILEIQGELKISPPGATDWVPTTTTNQTLKAFYRLRTGPNSRVALLWSDGEVVRFGPLTEIEILAPRTATEQSGLHLIRGIMSFFHREKPGRIRIITRGAFAGIEGTEFAMAVQGAEDKEQTTIWVVDGMVRLTNEVASLVLTNGQGAVVEPGKKAVPIAGFVVNDVLQWAFYYPAVLDVQDLPLAPDEASALSESLAAYRSGDLLSALEKYPSGRERPSDAENVYYAALLLAAGQAAQAEAALDLVAQREPSGRLGRLAGALRHLIAAVKREPSPATFTAEFPTELMAASYYEQLISRDPKALERALSLAEQATAKSPEFGFAWARVAELQFGFGRAGKALEALDRSLALSPRNAQALSLQGFLFAARNRTRDAIQSFDRAIATDSGLANAWLGRGLCRIHRGDSAAGREDLLVAAALEPQRSTLRSYLGKAFEQGGDLKRAAKELELAKELDPKDPTAWLYSALLEQRESRVNEAIQDLEKSQELNDNRAIYRSRLLMDQDRAVRSVNLARLYSDAGMEDVAFREAARAVNSDYANFSAHYFLAGSYNALRDPRLVNLRFESAEATEYLVANLLAPVGAGVLSPTISQQEYSRLFERDGLGVTSLTEYLSRGAWLENGAQYGTFGSTTYSLEGFYRSDPGERPNNDLEQMQVSLLLKQQFGPHDSAYVQASYFNDEAGDVAQRYDQRTADRSFRSHESQDGLVNVGYHHEWNPGVHTLLLAGYLPDRLVFSDVDFPTLAIDSAAAYAYPDATTPFGMAQDFHAMARIYFVEAQQILEHNADHLSIFGGRFQTGDIEVQSVQMNPINFQPFFPPEGTPASAQNLTLDLQRWSLYLYHHWQILDRFWLVGGLTYDHLEMPQNFLYPPISDQTETRDRFLPKAGLIWSPLRDTTFRFAYTRSLAGVSLEQSYRLEPAQVAGFTQAYRGVIPEAAVGGPVPGAPFDTFGLALEQKFATGTYLGVTAQILESEFDPLVGGYYIDTINFLNGVPTGVRKHLDYQERSLAFNANKLVGKNWSFGASYRLTDSKLDENLVQVVNPVLPLTNPAQHLEGVLHQVDLSAGFNHPTGFFGRFDALWSLQSNSGYLPDEPGDEFWHFNLWLGYRALQRKAELSLGLLNLTDQDYRLNPLTPYNELPHRRTLAARLLVSF